MRSFYMSEKIFKSNFQVCDILYRTWILLQRCERQLRVFLHHVEKSAPDVWQGSVKEFFHQIESWQNEFLFLVYYFIFLQIWRVKSLNNKMEDYNSTSLISNCSFLNISDNTLMMDCVQPPPEQYPVPLGKKTMCKKLFFSTKSNFQLFHLFKLHFYYFFQALSYFYVPYMELYR